jgi:hypothetical protein
VGNAALVPAAKHRKDREILRGDMWLPAASGGHGHASAEQTGLDRIALESRKSHPVEEKKSLENEFASLHAHVRRFSNHAAQTSGTTWYFEDKYRVPRTCAAGSRELRASGRV